MWPASLLGALQLLADGGTWLLFRICRVRT